MRVLATILICAAVLVAGAGGMGLLASRREPPKQAVSEETALRVEAVKVQPESVEATIKSHGEVRALNTVSIAPEVAGKIVRIHADLEVGGQIAEGDELFAIDPRDYEAHLDQARASLKMNGSAVERLEKQYAIDRERLKTLQRSCDLAEDEFGRIRELFDKDEVGTQSMVDQAERSYNTAADMAEQLGQTVALYPVRISEAESMVASAKAQVALAKVSLERTVVKAPFNARVESVQLEAGQFARAGTDVLLLADDSILEISVPLDSREAANWLKFADEDGGSFGDGAAGEAWFRGIEPVTCEIRWTEDKAGHFWKGVLNRVEKFEQKMRTVTVAVRIGGGAARFSGPDRLPLVEGMFCEVKIPGRELKGLYRLPATAVNFEGTVYLNVDGRLKSTAVEKAFIEGEEAFISAGLNPGDEVITTRLVDPLENSLLDIVPREGAA